jgi:type I restriction enzyme S subunit
VKWPTATIGSVCKPAELSDPRERPNVAFRYVDISSIDRHQKRIVAAPKIIGAEAPSRARQEIRTGDILVSTVRPNLNAVAVVPEELDGQIASTGFCVLRPTEPKILGRFLFYYCRTGAFVDALVTQVRGAQYPAVSDGNVKAIEVPLPPPMEQRRIVDILDQADRLRRLRAEADAKADRILPALFIKMFGNPLINPMRWPEVTLESQSDIVTGNTPDTKNREYYGSDVLWARPADLDGSLVVTETERMLSERGREVARVVPGKAVLVVCIGATLGKVGLAGDEMAVNQQINAVVPCNTLVPEFLYVQCVLLADRFRAAATKSTLPILNKSQFGNQKVMCPPKGQQEAFSRMVRIAISLHSKWSVSRKRLEGLFPTLHRRAFSGDLTATWRDAHMKELLQEMEQQAMAVAEVRSP